MKKRARYPQKLFKLRKQLINRPVLPLWSLNVILCLVGICSIHGVCVCVCADELIYLTAREWSSAFSGHCSRMLLKPGHSNVAHFNLEDKYCFLFLCYKQQQHVMSTNECCHN